MKIFKASFDKNRLMFQWRYFRGQTPWDTQTTPPEVYAYIKDTPPGRALDLGCGTGTNAITLSQYGWTVTGVDFSSKAIRTANLKAKQANLKIDFITADVTQLDTLKTPFDYVLDIGCLFTLNLQKRINYAKSLARLVRPKGFYMLYAWLPRPWKGKTWGISKEDVDSLLSRDFKNLKVEMGEESGFGSAWYWYERK